jgi:UDP-galactopyranose mutase
VMFTGGHSLFEAKRAQHDNIHPMPSAVDVGHFATSRDLVGEEPADQLGIAHPRFGFCGVIDERMDLNLLRLLAAARPDWQFVLIGPVVKIDPAELPHAANLHYLGSKSYQELPRYFSGWDVALMPFAINEATRFLSPTKTPEYLAAGLPVVSTKIIDVERHYGDVDAVEIVGSAAEFIVACETALRKAAAPETWLSAVDARLAQVSWDRTFDQMRLRLDTAIALRAARHRNSDSAGHTHLSRGYLPLPSVRTSRATAYDYLVVGAGFAGSVIAERLAADAGKRVLIIDRRPHVAGNAYDHYDAAGILVHKYGPHIFHTNSQEIVSYLSRFTDWRPYEHRVLAHVGGKLLPMPINRTTLNGLYGLDLHDDAAAAAFLQSRAEPVPVIRNSRDVVVSQVGNNLYRTFFEGYTRKQWGLDPSQLDKSVTSRVPTRTGTDDRYFLDSHQIMPRAGYTKMFENMLDHPNISIKLGVDYRDVVREFSADHTVFTGPIDEYFDHRFGKLPYRSLVFEHKTLAQRRFQPVAVVNYPSEDVKYTRITEYKHLTGQVHPQTSVTYEYASAEGDPYYPVPCPENQALYRKYEALAAETRDVTFVGRLGTYRYYNMDQVVGQALATYRRMSVGSAQRVADQPGSTLVGP